MPAIDIELIRACAAGDRQGLGALYDRHAPRLLAIAVRIVGNRREAEDILHDVFIEAWTHAGDYDPERASVRTWLAMRLRSRCLDHLRSAAFTKRGAAAEAIARGTTPDAARLGDAARVRALLDALPEDQRAVLVLSYFEGLSMSEIAERLSVPIGTVKSRAGRALARLKERTADDRSDP